MTTPAPFILVLYYSRHGSVLNLAKQIAKGIESQGTEAKIRTVADDRQEDAEYPLVTQQELTSCSGLALGSPCRFGTMAAPLKSFWESTSTNWLSGDLIDKPACVFTSSSSLHGGNEATLLSMSLPLLHHGMMLMGVPYSEPELHNTTSGGTPYGASHVSGLRSDNTLTKSEIAICKTLGQRLAITAKKLSQ
jgi:NAD(P)H dehydrogenase (quinone)